jgi:mono/diheme cytochrome c family protein
MADRGPKRDTAPSDRWVWIGAAVTVLVVTLVMGLVVIPALTDDSSEEIPSEGLAPDRLYTRHCSACHGAEGQGAIGPALGGGAVVEAYPDIDDQIQVITDGRGQMPPFGSSLNADDIRAIAEYERTELGQEPTTSTSPSTTAAPTTTAAAPNP